MQPWRHLIHEGIESFIAQQVTPFIDADHVQHTVRTPARVARALEEMTSGYAENPGDILTSALFPEKCSEMIHVNGIVANSLCAHHLFPFIGRVHVAYIPGEDRLNCVGLSKIPRAISALSRRLQTQEHLTQEIVNVLWNALRPAGCAAHIVAFHCCMSVRGAMEHAANTQTTAFAGCMQTGEARAEFLMALNRAPLVLM